MNFSSSDDENNPFEVALEHWRKMQRYGTIACILDVYTTMTLSWTKQRWRTL